ncbi:unnamed protein product [Coffea canephora]|uniref:Uncharacterized protein n=1 Tax=Coffea canephora TaxID=49390 RepID=A0A068UQW0_COFCA|nr:unnamed protein product [Coffea canephora]CDP10667.1 unnamed protein product [Coffea canephora]
MQFSGANSVRQKMKPYHFLCFLAVAAILVSSGKITIGEKHGIRERCMEVMEVNGCNLSSCKQQCWEVKNGNGVCLAKVREGYQCVCFFDC